MSLLGGSLAALIGVSLGLLGGGGSILTVPVLVYVMGFEPKESIAMGLAIVGTTSLCGAAVHGLAGTLQLRAALVFGAMAMGGTWAGARLSVLLPGASQLQARLRGAAHGDGRLHPLHPPPGARPRGGPGGLRAF